MSAKPFVYRFTVKELTYFLFKKKVCPKCGGRMRKSKYCEIVDGSTLASASTPLYIEGASEVRHYQYRFTCEECGKAHKLSELSLGRKQ